MTTTGSLMDPNSYRRVRLYHSVLTPRQSYHSDYAYLGGRVAMSDDDGMAFNTQVPAVRCAWVPVVVSCGMRHLMPQLPKNPTLLMPI
jgi:hypothetical protein